MGVPKFYRWLSERYPCLSEVVKEHQIPEFDNLYLDMNGIIHICSHPNDDDVHFRISEEKIIKDIFHYIEVLFRMIQPRKVFFMAVDGVAPRAKMNQQRGRRFRSAKEAEMSEKRAKDRGEELPKEARFDSNCITPGTSFMDRLQQQLKYFVASKITTDTLWQGVKVILSGHETPGEGEHKIMDFIRFERSKTSYDPDTRHCLYGLDADLVMLGMCTHDPHFSLLREEVRFGGKKTPQKRATTPEETTFHLLHLSLLREYLEHEFSCLRATLPFKYDVEGIIDDWILLGFLVGNDFLPHLPHLHINKGALSELYDIYKQQLPTLGGYINENGTLNLVRFDKFLSALAMREMDRFDDIYSDNKWLEGKTAKKKRAGHNDSKGGAQAFETVITDTPGPASVELLLNNVNPQEIEKGSLEIGNWQTVTAKRKDEQQDLIRLIQSADDFLTDVATSDTDEEDGFDSEDVCCQGTGRDNQYHMEFRQHKREYYIRKLGYAQVTPSVLKEQAEGYVRAIQWNLHYYYNGCKSWSWYYPHHFAPWITDIKNFTHMDLQFELSKPFHPFEQLLSVLPAASKELLPQCLQGLMFQESSPIIDYYPEEFENDLNGKQQDWEAVVLIPFIDEKRLLEAMQPYLKFMTPDEVRRNTHGPMQCFTYSLDPLGSYQAPQYFPNIDINRAKLQEIWREEWEVPEGKLRKGLLPETRLDVFYPGFPTLKHIPHRAQLKQDNVRVFEQPSRGFNMILTLEDQGRPNIEEVAENVLGQEIWVSWPHMVEAKVVAVKDAKKTFTLAQGDQRDVVVQDNNDGRNKDDFYVSARGIADRYKSRWGVVVGNTQIIVQACVMTGRKYVCSQHGKITLDKQWSKIAQPFALQTTRKDILVHDPSFTQYRTLPELFPVGSICFMLGHPNYGAQGTVTEISDQQKGRITLSFTESKDVDLSELMSEKDDQSLQYFPGFRAAQQLGISSHLLSRITGTVFILKGPKEAETEHASKVNIGLNLKHNKKNEEVCGFSKRGEDNNWIYSVRTVHAINDYMRIFPEIFDYLARSGNLSNDIFHHSDVFPRGNGEARLKELIEWMNEQPFSTASRQACGTLAIDETLVDRIVKIVDEQKKETRQTVYKMHVKPHLLFKPNLSKGGSMPDPDTVFHLLDRVVNVRQGFSVPLGLKGTITGLLQGAKPEDIIVEVLFDSEFSGGLDIRSHSNRSYRLPGSALINLSHGKERPQLYGQQQQQLHQYQQQQHGRYNNSKPVARVQPMGTPPRNQGQGWGQRRYQKDTGNDHDYYLQSKPVTIAQRPQQPSVVPPQQAISAEDNFCPSAAPDPKTLPKPTGFFGSKGTAISVQTYGPQQLTGPPQAENPMEALWACLQQPGDEGPIHQAPINQPLQEPSDLTSQLKSMLNIGGTAPPPFQSRPPPPFQQPGSYQRPSGPVAQPGSYQAPRAQGPFPVMPGSYPGPPPLASVPHYNNLPATAFVPLQVHMKHSSSRGRGGHFSAGPVNQGPSSQPAQAQPADVSVAAPEQNDRVLDWVNDAQAPVGPPPRTAGQPGQGRGNRKKRLAANFPGK